MIVSSSNSSTSSNYSGSIGVGFKVNNVPHYDIKSNIFTSGNMSQTRKQRRVRTIFSTEQLRKLEYVFEQQMYLVGEDRLVLAKQLNLNEAQVKIWFQNRRIKHRKTNTSGAVVNLNAHENSQSVNFQTCEEAIHHQIRSVNNQREHPYHRNQAHDHGLTFRVQNNNNNLTQNNIHLSRLHLQLQESLNGLALKSHPCRN